MCCYLTNGSLSIKFQIFKSWQKPNILDPFYSFLSRFHCCSGLCITAVNSPETRCAWIDCAQSRPRSKTVVDCYFSVWCPGESVAWEHINRELEYLKALVQERDKIPCTWDALPPDKDCLDYSHCHYLHQLEYVIFMPNTRRYGHDLTQWSKGKRYYNKQLKESVNFNNEKPNLVTLLTVSHVLHKQLHEYDTVAPEESSEFRDFYFAPAVLCWSSARLLCLNFLHCRGDTTSHLLSAPSSLLLKSSSCFVQLKRGAPAESDDL